MEKHPRQDSSTRINRIPFNKISNRVIGFAALGASAFAADAAFSQTPARLQEPTPLVQVSKDKSCEPPECFPMPSYKTGDTPPSKATNASKTPRDTPSKNQPRPEENPNVKNEFEPEVIGAGADKLVINYSRLNDIGPYGKKWGDLTIRHISSDRRLPVSSISNMPDRTLGRVEDGLYVAKVKFPSGEYAVIEIPKEVISALQQKNITLTPAQVKFYQKFGDDWSKVAAVHALTMRVGYSNLWDGPRTDPIMLDIQGSMIFGNEVNQLAEEIEKNTR